MPGTPKGLSGFGVPTGGTQDMKYTIRYTEPSSTLVNIRTVEARTKNQAIAKVLPEGEAIIVLPVPAKTRRKTRDFVTSGGYTGTIIEAKPTRYAQASV